MRYAIWAAVSTEAQAGPDKISLNDQQARCRAFASSRGWVESAGPYVVAGESRTRFIDLTSAQIIIPQLRELLNDAQRGRMDIVLTYDYNRFRDLLDQVARTLSAYRVQIYSLSQPVEPQPPDDFDPTRSDSAWLVQGMSAIISRSQVQDLRRKYKNGMPARVRDRGLPAISIPYGYRKPPGHETDRNAIPEQDPVTAPLVLKFKDLLLAGRSLRQLVALATGAALPPPRGAAWHPNTIREMLRNPFYAGYNRWGLSRNFTDPRTGTRYRNRNVDPAAVLVERGKHTPLWDDATHAALVEELDRRGHAYRGKKASQLSRLLTCATCGASLWMQHNGSRSEPERSIWRCPNKACGQAAIHHRAAVEQLGAQLRDAIRAQGDPRSAALPAPPLPLREQSKLDELTKRRERLVDIYTEGGLTKTEYMTRRQALDAQIRATEIDLDSAAQSAAAQAERQKLLAAFTTLADTLPEWLEHNDPLTTNRLLHLLLAHVRVDGDRIVELRFRD